MAIKELKKPVNVWCHHCDIGKGCKVYGEHPQSCRDFMCLWLQGVGPDHMRPDKSKVVLFLPESDSNILGVSVDPANPDAWRRGQVGAIVEKWMAGSKNAVVLMHGEKAVVMSKDKATAAEVQSRVQLYKP